MLQCRGEGQTLSLGSTAHLARMENAENQLEQQ